MDCDDHRLPRSQSLKVRALGAAVLLLTLLGVGLSLTGYLGQQRMLGEVERESLSQHVKAFDRALEIQREQVGEELRKVSGLAEVREALAKKDRENLLEYARPPFNRISKEKRLQITHLNFYLPTGAAFLQIPESDGSVPSATRPLVRRAMEERKLVHGMDAERGALAVWVAAPLYNKEEVVGFVEMGASLRPALDALKTTFGAELGLFLQGEAGGRTPDGAIQGFALTEATDQGLLRALAGQVALKKEDGQARRGRASVGERSFGISLIPLQAADGSVLGKLVLASDLSSFRALIRRNLVSALGISAAIFVGAVCLIVWLGARTFRPLEEISRVIPRVGRGDLTESPVRTTNDEIGQLADALGAMVGGLRGLVVAVRGGADQVAAASHGIAGTATQSAGGAEGAAAAVEELTATMHELNTNVAAVAGHAGNAAASVAETGAALEELAANI